MCRPIAVWARLPEPGDRRVDQVGLNCAQRVVVHPKLGDSSGRISFHNDVGRSDESHELLLVRRILQIEADASLVVRERREYVRPRPRWVAGAGALAENYVG